MNKQELEQTLADAHKLLAQYESELVAANAELMDEYRRDAEREPGSGRQEQARDEHQEKLRRAVHQCEQKVSSQKGVIANLEQQLAPLN
ncbi:TPA: hypothetical protein ACKRZ4_000917 [Proteus mirabilis]|uniref:hypothetical protein n=1 Tax=Proteus mirabilis TaxID=584 RepID=UPI0018C5F7C7|nr:hypothetical protein [Proteus mirabilis]ELB1685045.1 hypothetical protein [Proteus mirabilis]MBG2713287.1 hypothetical protein [Proteus mirabilis]